MFARLWDFLPSRSDDDVWVIFIGDPRSADCGEERSKALLLGRARDERYTLKSNLAIETLSQSVSQAIKGGSPMALGCECVRPVYAPLAHS